MGVVLVHGDPIQIASCIAHPTVTLEIIAKWSLSFTFLNNFSMSSRLKL
jgi:hypothetical protein